ncbi:MAG: SDR family oxidoreductase [Acidobacteriaceae bacterium]|nr:SDR family oxidoreductase [Acidobacteriaceae bacterium]
MSVDENRVVLITGASTGFGRLMAEALADEGFQVFATMRDIAGRNAQNRADIEAAASNKNVALHVMEMDVTSDSSVQACVAGVLSRTGKIDVVINNAGLVANGVTEAFTAEEFRSVFETNSFGVVRVNRAVLPAMRRRRSGLLVHISSGAGRVVLPYSAPYCASKFALEALADTYRFELAPFGVDSIIVEPGVFRTEIFQKSTQPADTARSAEYEGANYRSRIDKGFEQALNDPEATDPAEVVRAVIRLIGMPAGQRPLRTLVGAAVQAMSPYNELAEKYRAGLARAFGIENLLTLDTAGDSLPIRTDLASGPS